MKYHLLCHSRQGRRSNALKMNKSIETSDIALVSAEYEFIRSIESFLLLGKTMSILECENIFKNVLEQYDIEIHGGHTLDVMFVKF